MACLSTPCLHKLPMYAKTIALARQSSGIRPHPILPIPYGLCKRERTMVPVLTQASHKVYKASRPPLEAFHQLQHSQHTRPQVTYPRPSPNALKDSPGK